jgi:hypothetical protein
VTVGTKSVLFGAHCFLIHPLFVAAAWSKLYGFPWDLRLWAAFFLHDLGYVGKPDMDGPEGERHVEWGARVMHRLFDQKGDDRWRRFCLYHSRFYAKRDGVRPSALCAADKLAVALEPWWLYLPRAVLSGEVWEYFAKAGGHSGSKYNGEPKPGEGGRPAQDTKYVSMNLVLNDPTASTYRKVRYWHGRMARYLRDWAYEHKDGREDTWTPSAKREAA